MTVMNRGQKVAVAALFLLGTTAFIAGAAGPSPVADAVMNGDATAVRAVVASISP